MPQNFLRRLYLPLLLALCAMYAFRPIGPGYDFWAHAAVGRWIVHNAMPPTQGLFLWGSEPTPWIAHSWLCQAFFYGLLQLGGGWTPVGNVSVGTGPLVVIVFTTLMVCSVFALLWRLWRRCSQIPLAFWTPMLFALAIWVSHPRFQPRQEMLSALFLAVLLSFLVERTKSVAVGGGQWAGEVESNAQHGANQHQTSNIQYLTSSTRLAFVAFVTLFALWVNLHALVALGLVFLWTTAICDALQDRFDARSRWLLALALVCTAATFFNPYGASYWAAADQLKEGNMANSIEEWKPPWEQESLRPLVVTEMSLAFLALVAWLRNPDRRWAHLLWVVMMSYLFLKQRRHLWILAIVLLAVLAANANSLDSERAWRWWRRVTKQDVEIDTSSTRSSNARAGNTISQSAIPLPMRRIAQGGTLLIVLSWVVAAWPKMMNRTGVARSVPEKPAFALEQGQLRGELPDGRLFNDYSNSSYLQWRLNGTSLPVSSQGRNPIYIDLLNAYPDGKRGLLQEYFVMLKGTPESMALMKRRGVNLIYLPSQFRQDKNVGLFRTISLNPLEWRKVYSGDKDGTLWARRQPVAIPARSIIFDGMPPEKKAK